jgi:predicted ATPase/DNA-binding SARP family transcriptional activator
VSGLALYLLGTPRIELDGVPVKLDRRKALALLAYLAVTGESHRRDFLVNLLWPEADGARGRAALRRTLHALRQAISDDWLDADREEIGLRSGLDPSADPSTGSGQGLWLDVDQFHRYLAECGTHEHPAAQVCSACVPLLTEAVALVRGDFLSGFGLKDSFTFDDWQLFQTETHRRELADALQSLVLWHTSQREFEPAIGYAARRLALDPLEEKAHRGLMRLYAWSGRRSSALRQFEACVAVLEEQLGVPPHESTTELHRAIQEHRVPPPSGQGRAPKAHEPPAERPPFLEGEVPVERPVFVARKQELSQLDGHLQAAMDGQGKVVFVIGDAGRGKTAILQEFARRAQAAHPDLVVAGGNCNAYTGVGDPYLPFREVLDLLAGNVEAQWAAGAMTGAQARRLWNTLPATAQALVDVGPDLVDTFVPRIALLERARQYTPGTAGWLTRLHELVERKPFAPGMPSPQQSALNDQYTRVLQGLAQQVPLVLLLDDLQWADLGSISLLFHVGRHLRGSRILIVGAYRPEEVAIGRDGERHPLEPVVHEFQRDLGEIVVNLGRAGTRDFVESLLDSEPNRLADEFREMLHRQTRGHPLFTVELLRGLQERGDLVQDQEGRWVAGPALDWETLPARVEAAIAERMARLSQSMQAALRVASVEGEVFTAEVVARVQGIDGREVVGHLSSELDRRHRLVRAQAIERLGARRVSRYRFRNYLFQRYLYDSLDPVERSYLHEDVGSVLEELHAGQRGEISAIAPQLAWHFQEAGIAEKAIHYLHQAGERAVQLSAYQEGITHLTNGLELLEALPDPGDADGRLARDEQELALQRALSLAWQGMKGAQASEVELAHARARELCQKLGRPSQLSKVAGEESTMCYVRAELQRARSLAQEALDLAQQAQDPLLVAQAHWYLGLSLFSMGELTAARAHLEQMIDFYEPEQHHRAFVFLRGSDAGLGALAYAACCLWCLGYPDQALAYSQKALALARELGHPFTLADVLCFGGCMFSELRRDALAQKDHAEELILLASGKMPVWEGPAQRYRAGALTRLGQVEEGIADLHEAIVAIRAGNALCDLSQALCCLAEAQGKAGQPEEGLDTLTEALEFVAQTDQRHSEAELYRLRAELLLMHGEEAGAEASLEKAIDVARRQQAKSWELRATTTLARLWQRQGKQEEAREALAEIYGWFTQGFETPDLIEARALLELL